jgi:hypothetical protein
MAHRLKLSADTVQMVHDENYPANRINSSQHVLSLISHR